MINHHSRGFTLIELLVVIAIIGLLSSVVLASLNTARAKGRDAVRLSELTQLQTAVETYYVDHGYYPQSCAGAWAWGGASSAFSSCVTNYITAITPSYIGSLPLDPGTNGYGYLYMSNTGGTDYKILSYYSAETKSEPQGAPNARCPASCSLATNPWCADANDFAVYSAGAACW